ncbi:MAG: hypothetical protein JW910_03850, partial [Anaerolineae bacterium]|nr:hypothetical protein [Anaerolineae bacterium]
DIWFVLAFTGYANTAFLRECVAAQLRIVDEFQPDVLFTDLDPAAFVTAHLTGLPTAYPFQGIVDYHWLPLPYTLLSRALRTLLIEYGQPVMTPEELLLGPERLKLIPSIPELDGTPPDRPDVVYTGSLLGDIQPGAGFTPEPGMRYVFAYVGTGSISLKTLQRVLPLVFPDGGGVRCLVGAQSIERPYRIGSVEFMPYVPAADVLPHCNWTIAHAGQNTIVQSLLHGVPLLLFPGPIFERRFNAEKVQAAGVGFMGEVNEFTPEWFAARLARQAECAARARGLGDRIRSYGGPAAAVRALEAWATGQPIEDAQAAVVG